MPNTANAKTKSARSPRIEIPLLERAAITPNELAALFGRQTTFGYRLIYAGKVKVIREMGRMMIPRQEVARLLADVVEYGSKPLVVEAKDI